VECNNLYTKVSPYWTMMQDRKTKSHVPTTKIIFGGSSSNRTLTHILNQSSLIEIYHTVHVNIEDNFFICQRGTKHANPKLDIMLQQLCSKICEWPTTDCKTLNALVKGIQDYIGGDDIEEDEYVDEAINEDVMQMELISDDFDAV